MTVEQVIEFIRKQFQEPEAFIPLHEPRFIGNERKYVLETIDSTFVSSVGVYVDRFERMMQEITGASYAVATVNGTSALHVALIMAGVQSGDEVITQPLTFVATANAISYIGALPVFLDVDKDTLGLSPTRVKDFLEEFGEVKGDSCYNKKSGRKIAACVPMHTFGFPVRIDQITEICNEYCIPVVEDAAESIGTKYKGKQTGTYGALGIFSFNGNKTVTCGGGGAIITNDEELAKMAKHLTTTAKVPHSWNYWHDRVGYNYRLPNINAAMACAQLEQLDEFISNKRELVNQYQTFFQDSEYTFITEPEHSYANYWLMAILTKDKKERDLFLEKTNAAKVMTRSAWTLLHQLPMFGKCQTDELKVSSWLSDRIVNIPSSVRIKQHIP